MHSDEEWYFITEDLFSLYGYYFTKDDDLDKIHETAIECAKIFLSRLLNNKCVICGNDTYTNITPNPYKNNIIYSVCKDHYIEFLHGFIDKLIKELEHHVEIVKVSYNNIVEKWNTIKSCFNEKRR